MNFLLYIYTYICARIYIRVYTYFPSPSGSVRPSFMNARSTNDARGNVQPAQLVVRVTFLGRFSLMSCGFFFVVYHTRYRGFYFVFRVVPALRERWLHGCALILSPFFLLFVFFFFLLTILYFNTVDSTRRDGTIISLDLSSTIFAVGYSVIS